MHAHTHECTSTHTVERVEGAVNYLSHHSSHFCHIHEGQTHLY